MPSAAHQLLGRRLLILVAHPDDESFLSSGTIHENSRRGGVTDVICATYGEQGSSHLQYPCSPAKLKRIRRDELQAAARLLGVRHVRFLNIPDGQVTRHRQLIERAVRERCENWRPDALMSFGPDGITGHHDHVAICEVARRISRTIDRPLYMYTMPPRIARHLAKWFIQRRRSSFYHDGALVYQKPSLRIPISGRMKLRALRCHQSQLDRNNPYHGFPEYAVKEFLSAEYFTLDRSAEHRRFDSPRRI